MTHSISPRALLAAPLCLLLNACGAADPTAPTEPNVPVADYGEGVVLATLTPSDQQTIQVLEYPDGMMGIAEWQGPSFDPATPLAMANFRGGTMADFYEHVAGDALDATVMEKLRVTSELARTLREEDRAAAITAAEEATSVEDVALPTQDLGAPGLPATTELDAPAIQTRALDCAQDDSYYTAYASGWGSQYCKNPPGWEDWWCKTNRPVIEKNWTHGERYMLQIKNMSLCNTANIYVKRVKGNTSGYPLNNVPVGPNAAGMFWWEVSSREWVWYTLFSHLSGNEQSHLNLANYRQY